jgi:SAM-dependent methyltransferase
VKTLAQRRKICNRLGERHYPLAGRRDVLLKEAVARRLDPSARLLDGGCGPYLGLARMLAPKAGLAVGMDLQTLRREGMATGALGVQGDLEALPFGPGAFDVIVMRSVMEHLRDPAGVLKDMGASLRPGGFIVALAPSRWYYASIIGRLFPERAARRVLRFIFGDTVYDNYPTYYRANTPTAVATLARGARLDLVEARVCPHPPDYLKFSPLLFRLGVVFDRVAGWLPATRVLQASHLYILRKR